MGGWLSRVIARTKKPQAFRTRVAFGNHSQHPIQVILEPWCTSFEMPPGARWHLVSESERAGELEIEWGDASVTFYAWETSVFRVFDGEHEVGYIEGYSPPPVPEVPAGMTTREFVSMMPDKQSP